MSVAPQNQVILHVDMDAFFASVEQRDNPELRGKPIIVGGSGPRGVAAAASYEARKFGVRSAMPTREALRRCPELIVVSGRYDAYKEASEKVFAIFNDFTPLVRGISIDEAFLDISGSLRLQGTPHEVAVKIKQRIKAETGLTASVGIAPNKLVAKIASDLDKPDGIVEIKPEDLPQRLDQLPVAVIPGIGPKTLPRLKRIGIETMRDLRLCNESKLRSVFGKYTQRMQEKAAGIDFRPFQTHSEDKSISHEITFDQDVSDKALLYRHLQRLSDKTSSRLRKKGWVAGNVQVKLRLPHFETFTRQTKMQPATDDSLLIFRVAKTLVDKWWRERPHAKLRLIGVGVANLTESTQLDLFGQPNINPLQPKANINRTNKKLDATIDAIHEKFGTGALQHGQTSDLAYTERLTDKLEDD